MHIKENCPLTLIKFTVMISQHAILSTLSTAKFHANAFHLMVTVAIIAIVARFNALQKALHLTLN